MAQALWTGSLSFGLVNVPVSLVPAVRDLDLHFRQLHRTDGAPIEVHPWCSKEDVEVPYEEITHGYVLGDGRQVMVSDLELQEIEPRKTRTIDIEQFVDLADVDPIYFEHSHFLVPGAGGEGAIRAYSLLLEVMGRAERAALGRFVLHAKEYLALVRCRGGVLMLTTMLFADEIRDPKGVTAVTQRLHQPTREQLEAAVVVIEELSHEWRPAKYRDRYRQRLMRVIDRKRQGEKIEAPASAETPSPAPDLMAALERTLQELKSSGSGRSSRAQERHVATDQRRARQR